MKRLMGGVAVVATLAVLTPEHALAQRGGRGMRAGADRGARGGVEMVMRMRDRLELTDEQIQRLDQIRSEVVQRRNAHRQEMDELRSRVMAGEMEADELREVARARREASEEIRTQTRERVEAVLTDAQRETLEELGGRARAFQQGRAIGARQGMRAGGRGFQRGVRRPGLRDWGPRAGWNRRARPSRRCLDPWPWGGA